MNINTEHYKTFYFAAKHKSISRAAKALFISQPAVSKTIKKLEMQTGCTLFLRTPKGVRLTSEGQILFASVQKAFAHLQNAEKEIKKLTNNEAGRVIIGISNTLCKYFFLPYLEKFHKVYPKIHIQIVNVPSPNTLALLDEGEIDFGIISIDKNNENYNYISLMTLHDIFVTSRKPDRNSIVPIKNLSDYPVMMLEKGNQTRIYMDQFLSGNELVLEPDIEIGSMDFLIEFAKIGIGVACVIKEFVEQELSDGTLHQLATSPKPLPRQMGIVTKRNTCVTRAAQTFIDFILSLHT